jgi:hypothetical protein
MTVSFPKKGRVGATSFRWLAPLGNHWGDATDFSDVHVDGIAADLLADDLGNLFSFDVHILWILK